MPSANMSNGNASTKPSESTGVEPIAIIGMGCRWPNAPSSPDITTPSALWTYLASRSSSYAPFPSSRISLSSWYHPTPNRPGSFYTTGGCFLQSDPRKFDPTFFGINPTEAISLDPAQRKLLEVVYETIESSGTPIESLSGTKTGVFVGNFNYDHQLMQYRDTEYPEAYSISGGGIALLSNRINYVFNLQGPSLTLDTACSSSMYALHLACVSLLSGECTSAIVAGSNLILSPECQVFSSSLGAVSKSSRCQTFDAAADGYARADGIGALYIKKLKDAVRDGDPVRAVIRGTAINANGRTGGITHPDPDGQEGAIRRAYERGGLDPSETGYFECHGTGTRVGDPLEVEAIGRVFAGGREGGALFIGSIKSNMGHSEPASGIAGIMKTVLALEHGVIPPILGLKKLNPNINLHDGKLKIVQEMTRWPAGKLKRASVNSFGYGGANAHTILESIEQLAPGCGGVKARETEVTGHGINGTTTNGVNGSNGMNSTNGFHKETNGSNGMNGANGFHTNGINGVNGTNGHSHHLSRRQFLLALSSHNEATLKQNATALREHIDKYNILDLAYTLGCRRSKLASRTFVVASQDTMIDSLDSESLVISKAMPGSRKLNLGFVFTGQGAQWAQMGLDLMDNFPTYLQSIRGLDRVLKGLSEAPSWTIEDALRTPPESSTVQQASMSQPLVTAIQIALVDLLSSWNIKPTISIGHSSGEIAATYASGLLSAAQAVVVAYARGRAVSRNTRKGAMIAVGAGPDTILPHLDDLSSLTIACYNSPESLTVSGEPDDIRALKERLDAESIFARILHTDGNAYHSPHMKALGEYYETELNDMLSQLSSSDRTPEISQIDFMSTVYADHLGKRSPDTRYWRQNLESPVRFSAGLSKLVETTPLDFLIEIGPHSALQGPIRQVGQALKAGKTLPPYLSTIVRKKDGVECALSAAGTLFANGHDVDMLRVNAVEEYDELTNTMDISRVGKVIVDLPKYQWQYNRMYYFENRWTREFRLRTHPRHDLLGSRMPGGNKNEPMWRNVLKGKNVPWLGDHKIGMDIVFPTTGYLAMAVEAALQAAEIGGVEVEGIERFEFEDVVISAALLVPEEERGVELLTSLRPEGGKGDARWSFTVTSVMNGDGEDVFTEHCRGRVGYSVGGQDNLLEEAASSEANFKPVSSTRWYDSFTNIGLNYGPTFQGLSQIQVNENEDAKEASSLLSPNPTKDIMQGESRYLIHPAALDSALQLAIIAHHRGRAAECTSAFLPVSLGSLTISTAISQHPPLLSATAKAVPSSRGFTSNITISTPSSPNPFLTANTISFIPSVATTPQQPSHPQTPYTKLTWQPSFPLLATSSISTLYPPITHPSIPSVPPLEQLALHQIIQFHSLHPQIFTSGSSIPFLQRYLDWMSSKISLAQQNLLPNGQYILSLTPSERESEMGRLTELLLPHHGPETRLMNHMYNSLPAVYSGLMTGIQAAVQNNLLDDTYEFMELYSAGNKALTKLIALLSHQNPKLKILEVGGGTGSATKEILPELKGERLDRGYESYTFTDITSSFLAKAHDNFGGYKGMKYATFDMQRPVGEQGFEEGGYDLVVASNVIHATTDIQKTLSNIRRLLKPGGYLALFEIVQPRLSWVMILGTFSDFWNGDHDAQFPRTEGPFLTHDMWNDVLPQSGFGGVDIMVDSFAEYKEAAVIFARATGAEGIPRGLDTSKEVTLIYRNEPSPFVTKFAEYLSSQNYAINIHPLTSQDDMRNKRVIFLTEIDSPMFTTLTEEEWAGLKRKILTAGSSLWVTRGSLLSPKSDPRTAEYAMITGLASAFRAEAGDIKFMTVDVEDDDEGIFGELVKLSELAERYAPGRDAEYRMKEGVVYVPRLVGDDERNELVRVKGERVGQVEEVKVGEVKGLGEWRIKVEGGGENRGVYLDQVGGLERLEDGECRVRVRSVRAVGGEGGQRGCLAGGEFIGRVESVGGAVTNVKEGDEVCGITFGKLGNVVRERAEFVYKVEDTGLVEMSKTGVATCSAIYALSAVARVEKGESVLIRSDLPEFTLAAYQVSQFHGATPIIYTSQANVKILTELGVPSTDLLASEANPPFKLLNLTPSGNGFDIVLTDGDLQVQEKLIAPLGRLVRLSSGQRNEFVNNSKKNITVTSVDFESVARTKPKVIAALIGEARGMASSVRMFPTEVFPLGEIQKAFDAVVGRSNAVVLDLNTDSESKNEEATVPVHRSPPTIKFDPNSSYLLIGCLGGLGQSFTKFMTAHGARNLTFLTRSPPTPSTKRFLSHLHSLQISTTLIQGDVSDPSSIARAISASPHPIKGVIQAPLSLHDAFFSSMTLSDFNRTMRPRVLGTRNLHEALRSTPLDFFVMFSSWTTILGSVSQGNYMASNSFMDEFARWRVLLGLPGTALSLGHMLDVGIVSSNLQYQEHLNRMGLYGNSEGEFLSFCEAAVGGEGHILAGLEPKGLLGNNTRYPVDEMNWVKDPRFSHLIASFTRLSSDDDGKEGIVVSDDDESCPLKERIHKRVARLLFVSTEDIDVRQPIKNYGIDSMVAAELRNWLVKSTGVNVSLLELLSPTMSVEGLGRRVEEVRGGQNGE